MYFVTIKLLNWIELMDYGLSNGYQYAKEFIYMYMTHVKLSGCIRFNKHIFYLWIRQKTRFCTACLLWSRLVQHVNEAYSTRSWIQWNHRFWTGVEYHPQMQRNTNCRLNYQSGKKLNCNYHKLISFS